MDQVLRIVLSILHFAVTVGLIVMVVSQTNRHEGLGSLGGGSTGPIRGRAGVEEQLQQYTKYLAIGFMVLSLLVYLFASKFNWH